MSETSRNIEAIVAQQQSDLIAYLTRVKGLPAPTRDLVFMHSEAGVASGLEAATSERLAVMARNGQTEGIAELFGELEADQQVAAVENLARWASTFPLLPERRNAIPVLLAATAAVPDLPPNATALVASALLSAPGEPPPGALGDVVSLAERSRGPQRRALITGLKSRRDVTSDGYARASLIEGFPALDGAEDLYGETAAMAVGFQDQESLRRLLNLEGDAQARLLKLAEPTILAWLDEADEKARKAAEAEEAPTAAPVISWLVAALKETESSKEAVTRMAAWLLRAGDRVADEAVDERLSVLAPITDKQLIALVFERTRSQPVEKRATWLAAIDPDVIDGGSSSGIDSAAVQLWEERVDPEAESARDSSTLERLGELARHVPSDERGFPSLEAAIDKACAPPMETEPVAEERLRLGLVIEEFVDEELADTTRAADRMIESAATAMGALPSGVPAEPPGLRSVALALIDRWIKDASPAALGTLQEAATQDGSVALDPEKAQAALRAAGLLAEGGQKSDPPLDAEEVAELAENVGARADGATEAWLTYFFGKADDLWILLSPTWTRPLPADLRSAFAARAKALSKDRRQSLAEEAIAHSLEVGAPPSADNWEAIGLRELSGSWLIDALAARDPGEDLSRWRISLEIARQRILSSRSKPLVAQKLLAPLIALGTDDSVALALDNLELTSRNAGEGLFEDVSLTDSQAKMVTQRLRALGWRKTRLGKILGVLGDQLQDSSDEN